MGRVVGNPVISILFCGGEIDVIEMLKISSIKVTCDLSGAIAAAGDKN